MLAVYTLEQADQWDSIVRSFADYDTYWLSGYVKAFQIHGDGEPMLFYFEADGTRGVNVVMKRDIARDPHFFGKLEAGMLFDLATVYGYGGWLIEGTETDALFSAYEAWCRKNSVVSEFVRFHPMVKNHLACRGAYEVVELGEVVHMELKDPQTIWEQIASKNRNVIRKAQKNNVRIYNGRCPQIYETFRTIYNGTMDKDQADKYYYFEKAFYDSLLFDLPGNAQVFYACLDEKIISASIMLTANGRMNYHLSGSVREYNSLAPTNLLLYHAALWGCANGCKTLYLGGGVGSGEDSLFKFKRSFFKGPLNRFCIGKKIFDREKYDALLSMRTGERRNFFPEYRA